MILSLNDLYPTKIATGDLSDTLTKDEFIAVQDVIENASFETHERLQKPQSLPAITDDRLFLINHKSIARIKEEFETGCIAIHEEKYPHLKGKFHVYDSVCKGMVINSKTTVQDTMSNYPWHYTGIAIIRCPENLPAGQGDIVFIDPLPVSDKGDQAGIKPKRGNMAIFPAWLKYRFRPLVVQEHEYDTIMILVMNSFVVHERIADFEAKERHSVLEPAEIPVFQLGPTGNREEVELKMVDDANKSKEINIGLF